MHYVRLYNLQATDRKKYDSIVALHESLMHTHAGLLTYVKVTLFLHTITCI
jgi:hypothetical protein